MISLEAWTGVTRINLHLILILTSSSLLQIHTASEKWGKPTPASKEISGMVGYFDLRVLLMPWSHDFKNHQNTVIFTLQNFVSWLGILKSFWFAQHMTDERPRGHIVQDV